MTFIFERQLWSDEAEAGLGETLRDDVVLLKSQVNKGIASLWQIDGHSWMITRAEPVPGRKPELVVCCYKGQDLKSIAEYIKQLAIKQGFGSIRYHTRRKGLNRLLSELNFEFMETVYQLQLEPKENT